MTAQIVSLAAEIELRRKSSAKSCSLATPSKSTFSDYAERRSCTRVLSSYARTASPEFFAMNSGTRRTLSEQLMQQSRATVTTDS